VPKINQLLQGLISPDIGFPEEWFQGIPKNIPGGALSNDYFPGGCLLQGLAPPGIGSSMDRLFQGLAPPGLGFSGDWLLQELASTAICVSQEF
jgi:hypothetical protein